MIRIEGRTILIHRGDSKTITYKIPTEYNADGTVKTYYSFQAGDVIRLSIFEKDSDYSEPIKEIVVTVEEVAEQVSIPLLATDTNIGDPSPKSVDYKYEISLNGIDTTTGYDDEEGDAIFRILPAKGSDS